MYDTLIQLEMVDGVRIVEVGNEVDIGNAHVLERYLDEAAANTEALVVSLADCRYFELTRLGEQMNVCTTLAEALAKTTPVIGLLR